MSVLNALNIFNYVKTRRSFQYLCVNFYVLRASIEVFFQFVCGRLTGQLRKALCIVMFRSMQEVTRQLDDSWSRIAGRLTRRNRFKRNAHSSPTFVHVVFVRSLSTPIYRERPISSHGINIPITIVSVLLLSWCFFLFFWLLF